MKIKIMVCKKEKWEWEGKEYYKISFSGDGISLDLQTTEKVYNIAQLMNEYEATVSLKQIKDKFDKPKMCLDKITYLKAV